MNNNVFTYCVVVISKNASFYKLNDINYIVLPNGWVENNNSVIYNDNTYLFDYLIVDDLSIVSNLHFEKEHKRAITNYFLESSIENIFAIGEANNSNRDIIEELNTVIEYITEE